MIAQVTITLSGPGLGVPAELLARLAPAKLAPVAGEAGAKVVRTHLRGLAASRKNALGGRSTQFYGRAVRAVQWRVDGDIALVEIPAPIGIRQRFYGGTIKPRQSKFLTIPAIPEAHGKRAREFADLSFAVLDGKPALVRKKGATVTRTRGRSVTRRGIENTTSTIGISSSVRDELEVVYWLRRSVTQRPDPTVLPAAAETSLVVARALRQHLLAKPAGPSAP